MSIWALVDAIRDADAKAGLELISSLASKGVDLRKFLGDAIGFFRGAFLAKYSPNVEELSDEPGEVIADWRAAAEELPPASVLRAVDLLSEALIRLREGREERLMLELAILKLTRPELAEDTSALLSRVEKLERGSPRTGVMIPPARGESAPQIAPEDSAGVEAVEEPVVQPVADVVSIDRAEEPTEDDHPVDVDQVSAELHVAPTMADLERIWPQLVAGVRENLGARREALFPRGHAGECRRIHTGADRAGQHGFPPRAAKGRRKPGCVHHRTSLLVAWRERDHRLSLVRRVRSRECWRRFPDPVEVGEVPIPDKDTLMEAPADGTDPLSLLEDAFRPPQW